MLVSALVVAAAAARSGPVAAADDPQMIRYHSPCHTALVEERRASDRLKNPSATREDARRTLNMVAAGMDWNNHACRTMAGRSPEDNAVRDQMYLVNDAFLLSLRGQAQTVLGEDASATYARANAQLQKCMTSPKLSVAVRSNCRAQIADNNATSHPAAMAATEPCQMALDAANDAGNALKAKDYASFEKAYARASAGLDANKNCRQHPQMRDLNAAYLLTWRAVADRYLDVPFSTDPALGSNAADPFAVANALFRQCQTAAAGFPASVRTDCGTQLASNQTFLADLAAQPPPVNGQTTQPLTAQPVDWPYALRPDFVWDAPCKETSADGNHPRCADEEERNGSGTNGWGPVPAGQATPLSGDKERVLFATIRNCDDLHRLFSGQPPQFSCDAFKSNILLVAAQRKPDQQCTMTNDSVSAVSTPSTAVTPRDAVVLTYTLTCAPPVAGSSGNTVLKTVMIPRSNAHGEFANVTFSQSGGGGPRGATR